MSIKRYGFLLGALLGLGCSSPTELPAALNGNWSHLSVPFTFSYSMTLSTQDRAVAGGGDWSGEACCSGPLVVSGSVNGDVVALDLTFTATAGASVPPGPFTQHFEGRLVGHDLLSGTVTQNGQTAPYTYQRMH